MPARMVNSEPSSVSTFPPARAPKELEALEVRRQGDVLNRLLGLGRLAPVQRNHCDPLTGPLEGRALGEVDKGEHGNPAGLAVLPGSGQQPFLNPGAITSRTNFTKNGGATIGRPARGWPAGVTSSRLQVSIASPRSAGQECTGAGLRGSASLLPRLRRALSHWHWRRFSGSLYGIGSTRIDIGESDSQPHGVGFRRPASCRVPSLPVCCVNRFLHAPSAGVLVHPYPGAGPRSPLPETKKPDKENPYRAQG